VSCTYSFERLDLADPAVRRRYEETFFASFERVQSNRLVRTLWLWDHDTRRLATRIPYEDQIIFAMRTADGGIETALAVNVAMKGFQAEAFGFERPSDTTGCFEVLTFFTASDGNSAFKRDLWRESVRTLSGMGFHTGFATTAIRPLLAYLRTGWKVQEVKIIGDEIRFFLEYRLDGGQQGYTEDQTLEE
jgi:hypothetical protein